MAEPAALTNEMLQNPTSGCGSVSARVFFLRYCALCLCLCLLVWQAGLAASTRRKQRAHCSAPAAGGGCRRAAPGCYA